MSPLERAETLPTLDPLAALASRLREDAPYRQALAGSLGDELRAVARVGHPDGDIAEFLQGV